MRKLSYEQRKELVCKDHSGNSYYKDNPNFFNEVIDYLKQNDFHAKGIQRLLRHSKRYVIKWIESVVPALADSFYSVTTKCYWMLHDLHEYPKCIVCGNPIASKRNTKLFELYPKTCSDACRYADETSKAQARETKLQIYGKADYMHFGQPEFKKRIAELHDGNPNWNNAEKNKQTCLERYSFENAAQVPFVKEKMAKTSLSNHGVSCILCLPEFHERSKQTCLERYGYENPSQVPEIRAKQARQYLYEGIRFDSKPELAYFIWLTNNHVNFTYQPSITFEYEYEGKMHCYIPDFLVEGQLVEIKGDQFFNEDGTMCNPYDRSQDALYEAKHQCMLKNDVKILRHGDYMKYIQHVEDKYGKHWFDQFRTSKI